MSSHVVLCALPVLILGAAGSLSAQVQTIGTLSWKMEPYCNTLTLTIVQDPAGIRLQGTEDLCEAGSVPQAVDGSAVLDAGGIARLGLSTGVPGVFSVEGNRIVAAIDTATLNGTWSDDAGRSGTLVRVGTTRNAGVQRGVAQTWVHIVTTSNRTGGNNDNVSCFSHPLTDGNPNAVILFAHNRGSQTNIRPLVGSLVSLYYDDNGTTLAAPLANNVWCLSRNDSLDMPLGAGFTIRVVTR